MTGKLADTVMSVRNGEQIARKYQPIVYNPSTPAQVAQRAKLKLLSQLSAVLAPVIAMRRQGSVSSRNLFTKVNFPATTYADNTADINMTAIKLTKSAVGLPPITAVQDGFNVNAEMSLALTGVDRVVYVAVVRQADGSARVAASAVATTAGEGNGWPVVLTVGTTAPSVVYAYGVRDNTEAARVAFGNLNVTAEEVAQVVTSRNLTETDITLTDTQAVETSAGE